MPSHQSSKLTNGDVDMEDLPRSTSDSAISNASTESDRESLTSGNTAMDWELVDELTGEPETPPHRRVMICSVFGDTEHWTCATCLTLTNAPFKCIACSMTRTASDAARRAGLPLPLGDPFGDNHEDDQSTEDEHYRSNCGLADYQLDDASDLAASLDSIAAESLPYGSLIHSTDSIFAGIDAGVADEMLAMLPEPSVETLPLAPEIPKILVEWECPSCYAWNATLGEGCEACGEDKWYNPYLADYTDIIHAKRFSDCGLADKDYLCPPVGRCVAHHDEEEEEEDQMELDDEVEFKIEADAEDERAAAEPVAAAPVPLQTEGSCHPEPADGEIPDRQPDNDDGRACADVTARQQSPFWKMLKRMGRVPVLGFA